MSDTSPGPGWWRASDGRWYPPEQHPSATRSRPDVPLPGPTGTPPRPRGGVRVWMVALAVVVAVAIGAGAVVVLTGDDETADAGDVAELVLEPIGAAGSDPFTDSVAVTEVPVSTEVSVAEGSPDVRLVAGTQPGLYGGTGQEQVCDPAALVSFLEANRDEAEAFADVLGIDPDGIGDHVAGLTPVLLRVDTRVTNHGFADGEAQPFQAVLQAGTAVLVDAFGTPRVKCNCGNPLAAPADLPEALPAAESSGAVTLVGDPWPTWDPAQAVAVQPGPEEVAELTVVDVETGEEYAQPVGSSTESGRASGDVDLAGVDWANFTYPPEACADSGGPFTLVDGRASGDFPASGVMLVDEPELYGDLDDDGSEDVVVELACNFAGSPTTFIPTFLAWSSAGDEPVLLGAVSPTFYPRGLSGASLDGPVLVLDGLELADGDPLCCPTIPVQERWAWDGAAFVQQ